ncbi:MAG: cytochrome c-type biogenesis protein CcmH [Thermoanaerobacteraceae bacterium]|nr:cytochrome c-type biogenesis protein CcmH [Thermoanaerobacteraceae bacterium]
MLSTVRVFVTSFVIGIFFMFPAYSGETAVNEQLFKEVEAALMCTDGCGMYLRACDNDTAQQMRAEIREKLAAGMTPREIYGYMIGVYGEEVMAAPPPSILFNLTAWVTPFLTILGGGLMIYLALDKWVFYRRAAEKDISYEAIDLEEYEGIIEEEMKKYY